MCMNTTENIKQSFRDHSLSLDMSIACEHANLGVNMFKGDVQCAQKEVVHCWRWNCGIPSPGKSGSSQIISWWGSQRILMVQGGLRDEKKWMPRICSSLQCLRDKIEEILRRPLQI